MTINSNSTARWLILCATFVTLACSKSDQSASDTPVAAEPASGTSAAAPAATGGQRGNSVRGRIVSVTDTMLTVSARGSDVRVRVVPPLEVYSRRPAKLSQVTENSFVGITSAPQSDGTLQASEIHIFPEKLRGMNEGSFPMGPRGGSAGAGGGGAGNTMTNGTVSGSRMTNGTVAGGGNTMTNGTVGAQSGNTVTVRFQSSSQTISIPSNVTVTELAVTQTKLAPGMNVVIPAKPGADGTLETSIVILSPGGQRRR